LKPDSSGVVLSPGIHARAEGVATNFRNTLLRGGVGHSLVVDPAGGLWPARSYEDFDTTYLFTDGSCEIDTLTPRYAHLREYHPR
jgi:hypothetical protein